MRTGQSATSVVEVGRTRIRAGAGNLDTYQVAGLVVDLAQRVGVTLTWEQACLPLLTELSGHPADVAAERVLTEGIRAGLDTVGFDRGVALAPGGVLLAAAEREDHSLALHALAAALRERGRSSVLLGPAVPWIALTAAVRRVRPGRVVLWSQSPVTGRAYRLVRLARELSAVRFFAAGPGWPTALPPPVGRLTSLSWGIRACLG